MINPPAGDRSGYTRASDGSWSADQEAFPVAEHTTNCTLVIPDSGFAYLNQHLDWGLKGPNVDIEALNGRLGDGVDRYGKHGENAVDPKTIGDPDPIVLIPELAEHEFCVDVELNGSADPDQGGCDSMQNDNEFKKNPGVAGRVTVGLTIDGDAVPQAVVKLTNSDGDEVGSCDGKNDKDGFPLPGPGGSTCPGFDLTDLDGWWQIIYKHKGKPALYTVEVSPPSPGDWSGCEVADPPWTCDANNDSCTQQVQLKGNAFSEVNLELLGCP